MARDLNSINLVGRLGRDAELSYTQGGQPLTKFSVAVNRQKKDGDQWVDAAVWVDVVYWGKGGLSISQYLVKGKRIALRGSVAMDKWDKDGETRTKLYVIAEEVQLLDGGERGTAPEGQGKASEQPVKPGSGRAPGNAWKAGPAQRGEASGAGQGDDFSDDIPF